MKTDTETRQSVHQDDKLFRCIAFIFYQIFIITQQIAVLFIPMPVNGVVSVAYMDTIAREPRAVAVKCLRTEQFNTQREPRFFSASFPDRRTLSPLDVNRNDTDHSKESGYGMPAFASHFAASRSGMIFR